MKVLLTLDEVEIKKVKGHLRIIHINPSVIFPGKKDVTIDVANEQDAAAMFVAGRVVPFNQPRRA